MSLTAQLIPDGGLKKTRRLSPIAFPYDVLVDGLEKARQVYEKINSQLSSKWNGDIYVKSFYVLGRVAEQQGDRVKAVEQYRKFLNLWKDADPGIAEVEDAKKSLAGLKATLLPSCYCLKSKRKCVRGQ